MLLEDILQSILSSEKTTILLVFEHINIAFISVVCRLRKYKGQPQLHEEKVKQ